MGRPNITRVKTGLIEVETPLEDPTGDWYTRAQCFQPDRAWQSHLSEMAYGDAGVKAQDEFIAEFCTPCPVRLQCLQAGMTEAYGVWGGLLPCERASIRRHAREVMSS